MDLTRFQPLQYTKLADIYEAYFRHNRLYMARFRYTLDEYIRRDLPLCPGKLTTLLTVTTANWIAIVLFTLAAAKQANLDFINQIYEHLLRVRRVDILFRSLACLLLSTELMCLVTFYEIVHFAQTGDEIFHEYTTRTVDLDFTVQERRYLLQRFTQMSTGNGYAYKGCIVFLAVLNSIPFSIALQHCASGALSVHQLGTIVLFEMAFLFSFGYVFAMMLIVMVYFMFSVELFNLKMNKCYYRAKAPRMMQNIKLISIFQRHYVKLFREVILFSYSSRNTVLQIDFIVKLFGTQFTIFFAKQLTSYNLFCYVLIALAIGTFLNTQFVYTQLARLPSKNLRIYQELSSWNARNQSFRNYRHYRLFTREHLRANLLIQSIANNPLGFSCGNLFLVTKFKYYCDIFAVNFFLLFLFYKKIVL